MANRNKYKNNKKKKAAGVLKFIKIFIFMVMIGISIFLGSYIFMNWGLNVTTQRLYLDIRQNVEPQDFIVAYDASVVSVSFKEEPMREEGTQEVTLVITNKRGKTKEYDQELTYFRTDYTPPELVGVHDIEIYVGDTVSYLEGVTSVDAEDGHADITVEKSQVNTRQAGVYPVIYTATDKSGNSSSQEASVIVKEISATQMALNELADSVINQITTPDMQFEQKIKAIYEYVFNSIGYTGERLAQDWESEGYAALSNIEATGMSGGDCHTYCAVSKALLERVGAQVLIIQRRDGYPSNHFWNLVNIGSGWYHFDATRLEGNHRCFMQTDAQVRSYTDISSYYYDFDATQYPPTPQKFFEYFE